MEKLEQLRKYFVNKTFIYMDSECECEFKYRMTDVIKCWWETEKEHHYIIYYVADNNAKGKVLVNSTNPLGKIRTMVELYFNVELIKFERE